MDNGLSWCTPVETLDYFEDQDSPVLAAVAACVYGDIITAPDVLPRALLTRWIGLEAR